MKYINERRYWKRRRKEKVKQRMKEQEASQRRLGQELNDSSSDYSDLDSPDIVPGTAELEMYADSKEMDDASSTGSEDTVLAMARQYHAKNKSRQVDSATDGNAATTSNAHSAPSTSLAQPRPSTSRDTATVTQDIEGDEQPMEATGTISVTQDIEGDDDDQQAVAAASDQPPVAEASKQVVQGKVKISQLVSRTLTELLFYSCRKPQYDHEMPAESN